MVFQYMSIMPSKSIQFFSLERSRNELTSKHTFAVRFATDIMTISKKLKVTIKSRCGVLLKNTALSVTPYRLILSDEGLFM